MKRAAAKRVTHVEAIRQLALRHDGVTEGIACKGTVMERHTLKTGDKAFVFVGATDAMVKLDASLAEAKRLAKSAPGRYTVGKTAWVKLTFSADEPPALDVLERWIAESYGLVAKPAVKKKRATR